MPRKGSAAMRFWRTAIVVRASAGVQAKRWRTRPFDSMTLRLRSRTRERPQIRTSTSHHIVAATWKKKTIEKVATHWLDFQPEKSAEIPESAGAHADSSGEIRVARTVIEMMK